MTRRSFFASLLALPAMLRFPRTPMHAEPCSLYIRAESMESLRYGVLQAARVHGLIAFDPAEMSLNDSKAFKGYYRARLRTEVGHECAHILDAPRGEEGVDGYTS